MPYKKKQCGFSSYRESEEKFIFPWIGFYDFDEKWREKSREKQRVYPNFVIHMSSRFWRMIFYDCCDCHSIHSRNSANNQTSNKWLCVCEKNKQETILIVFPNEHEIIAIDLSHTWNHLPDCTFHLAQSSLWNQIRSTS